MCNQILTAYYLLYSSCYILPAVLIGTAFYKALLNLKEPCAQSKAPGVNQKSPVFNQKSPVFNQKSPVFNQKSPVLNQKSPFLLPAFYLLHSTNCFDRNCILITVLMGKHCILMKKALYSEPTNQ